MTTLGDLAKRLYDKFAATQELLEPKKIRFEVTRWEDLPEWRQEVWVTVAAEAVKVGAEIRQEIAEQDAEENRAAMRKMVTESFDRMQDRRLLNDPDLQTSLGQMERGEGRVLVDDPVIGKMFEDVLADMPDEAPKLCDLAAQPRRFARDCE